MASGLLKRNINAATGVSASRAPPRRPAAWPDQRRTVRYVSATVPMPHSASGSSMEKDENPKMRADSTMSHMAAGGLSTVIALAESSEPNSQAFQDSVPDLTAAA